MGAACVVAVEDVGLGAVCLGEMGAVVVSARSLSLAPSL